MWLCVSVFNHFVPNYLKTGFFTWSRSPSRFRHLNSRHVICRNQKTISNIFASVDARAIFVCQFLPILSQNQSFLLFVYNYLSRLTLFAGGMKIITQISSLLNSFYFSFFLLFTRYDTRAYFTFWRRVKVDLLPFFAIFSKKLQLQRTLN